MASRYPIILAHGVAIKDLGLFKSFGKIEKTLKKEGYRVYTAKMDAFGTTATNAEQLKKFILNVLEKEGTDKVNIIAHSKGGLDSRYMLENLDMGGRVASLTTLCTPHGGSACATSLINLPKGVVRFLEISLNLFYKLLGDERPNALAAGKELALRERAADEVEKFPKTVYCRSYSATKDELVSKESAAFANYMGHCLEEPMRHIHVIDHTVFSAKKRKKIYGFYSSLCQELTAMGF